MCVFFLVAFTAGPHTFAAHTVGSGHRGADAEQPDRRSSMSCYQCGTFGVPLYATPISTRRWGRAKICRTAGAPGDDTVKCGGPHRGRGPGPRCATRPCA